MAIDYSVDQSNLKDVLADFPNQIIGLVNQPLNITVSGKFTSIVYCGMGGSALIADVISAVLEEPVPIFASRNYTLPRETNKDSLVIVVSYSGNTEETVAALEEAIKRNLTVVALSTGGRIADIAQNTGHPYVKIPPLPVDSPRCSTGLQLTLVMQVLHAAGLIRDYSEDLAAAAAFLKETQLQDQAQALANNLVGRIPVVYGSDHLFSLARIFKIKINENAKAAAFWNYLPEMNHNESNSFVHAANQGNFSAIFLRDPDDHPRNHKRFDITKKLAEEHGLPTYEYELPAAAPLHKFLWGISFGDWVSYYLALALGTDPTPIVIIEDFKKRMAQP